MSFKDFYLKKLSLALTLYLNSLCSFGRGQYEKHSCKITSNWDPVVQEMLSFKDVFFKQPYFSSGSYFV